MPISIWLAGIAVAQSPRWPAEGCVWHRVQENQLVWGGTQPQAFTSSSSSFRSGQLVTLCATWLHRLALRFNTETIWFSSLFKPPFMEGLESLWGELYPILFLSFLGPSCNHRCLESALYLLSAVPEGVCSHTCFYSPSSPPISVARSDWHGSQPGLFWQLLLEQVLSGEL